MSSGRRFVRFRVAHDCNRGNSITRLTKLVNRFILRRTSASSSSSLLSFCVEISSLYSHVSNVFNFEIYRNIRWSFHIVFVVTVDTIHVPDEDPSIDVDSKHLVDLISEKKALKIFIKIWNKNACIKWCSLEVSGFFSYSKQFIVMHSVRRNFISKTFVRLNRYFHIFSNE